MGLITLGLQQPEKRANPLQNPAIPLSAPEAWGWITGGTGSDAGELVNDETALAVSTVYACIRVLSESVASLPLRLYRKTPQGRLEAVDQPLSFLLKVAPNEEMSAFTFWEVIVKSMALCGNGYAEIQRDATGEPVALWPLHPRETCPIRLPTGELAYQTRDGMAAGATRIIAANDILHIPLFASFDGLVGLSPLDLTRQTIGQARAVERFGSRFFKNYATPAVAIRIPEEVDPKTKALMRADWENMQSGGDQHRVAILDQGMQIETLSLSPDECQFIATRTFLREELAAIYRVPVHMVGSNERLSQASAIELNLSFVVDGLRPYLSRIEGELVRKLLKPKPRQTAEYEVAFDVRERLRGDFQTTMQALALGRQWGFLTANQCAAELGDNSFGPVGDVLLYPVNMGNAEALLHEGAKVPPQATQTTGTAER